HPPTRKEQRIIDRSLGPGVTHCAIGTWGAEMVDEIAPEVDDFVVEKKGGSGFIFTPLHRVLRNLNAHRLIVTGGAASGCVLATVSDGVALGYDVTAVGDAVYGGGPNALDVLQQWCPGRSAAAALADLGTEW